MRSVATDLIMSRFIFRPMGVLFAVVLLLGLSFPARSASMVDVSPASTGVNSDDELVYLDQDGVIKVFDPVVSDGLPELVWQSPGNGWQHIALGDFNADGDDEIVAISGIGGNRLAIFDPVAEGIGRNQADGYFNGIPWQLLDEIALPGTPIVVATGNFHAETPADEIAFFFKLNPTDIVLPDDPYRFVIILTPGLSPDGRSWTPMLSWDSGNELSWIGTGDLDSSGLDELAFISRIKGTLYVYKVQGHTLIRIFRDSDHIRVWQDGDIGQFVAGGDEELAVGRETTYPLPSLYVIQHAGGEWFDVFKEYFDPPPESVFLGDIGGNGDDEVIVLRFVSAGHTGKPRLFVRDNGNDSIGIGEPVLDADNGYRTGVAGDIDGDGRDEIVIMRNNRIRMFTEPEKSAIFTDEPATTGSEIILAGNLDANGLTGASRFRVTPGSVAEKVTAGAKSEKIILSLVDSVNDRSIPFTYRVENNSSWIVLSRSSAKTPATISITLDASGLTSGTLNDRVIVDTNDPSVVNAPYAIDVSMTVEPGVLLVPDNIVVVQSDCGSGGDLSTVQVAVRGTPGTAYTLTLKSPVNWAQVQPRTGTLPSIATVTFDGDKLGSGMDTTKLLVRATINGKQVVDRANITLLCAESTIYLPVLHRK